MKSGQLKWAVSAFALALGCASQAAETISYQYDARGRLIEVKRTGTVNNNVQTNYTHDKANNRKKVVVINSPNPPPPVPPPPPPPTNQPPVANTDSAGTMARCSFKSVVVTTNDTDPEGNLPLSVTAASGVGGLIATVVNSTTIQLESTTATGGQSANYTVADSLGATATGTVNVTVTGGTCL